MCDQKLWTVVVELLDQNALTTTSYQEYLRRGGLQTKHIRQTILAVYPFEWKEDYFNNVLYGLMLGDYIIRPKLMRMGNDVFFNLGDIIVPYIGNDLRVKPILLSEKAYNSLLGHF